LFLQKTQGFFIYVFRFFPAVMSQLRYITGPVAVQNRLAQGYRLLAKDLSHLMDYAKRGSYA
jgi:hypothetical protein